MSKVTKSERIAQLEQIAADQARAFKIMADRLKSIEVESKWIIHMTGIERSQLKQLDQSVFDGLDEKWRFSAVDKGGAVWVYSGKPDRDCGYWFVKEPVGMLIGRGYDASNWQNSLIERDTAKELAEVDLSSELTGSELCKAMLARGDKWVVCRLADTSDEDALNNGRSILVTKFDGDFYHKEADQYRRCAVPINNQGEPLTASEVGL